MTELLRTTSENDFTPLSSQGQPVNLLWSELRAYLEARLGPAGADLLTEPVSGANGQTDWYGREGAPRARQDLLAQLEEMKQALAAPPPAGMGESAQQLAALIPMALTIPDDSCLLSGPHGPVLVAWGNRPVQERLQPKDITALGAPLPPGPPPSAGQPPSGKPPLPPVYTLAPHRPLGPWLRWLLIGAVLGLTALVLWLAPLLRFWLNMLLCRWPHFLFWLILFLVILLATGLCSALLVRAWPLHAARRAAPMGRRVKALQLLLRWPDQTEEITLALDVLTPSGQRLDAMAPAASPAGATTGFQEHTRLKTPDGKSETVFWELDPPPGLYTVMVDPQEMPAEAAIPFRLEVFYKGRRVVNRRGIARAGQGPQPVVSFVVPD
ncbi:hypothetical protein E3E11_04990 [Oecophyllibacter saccharovorans]|uniref:hypothetical protein n=1 Tax=Oecophyllibacter saccharovorans TaxID=2558360 RepID=UPI0011441331|nr:hypothetical protein [Oecophyllibacter saccharovorans]QDH15310.1 hypothetical protein E3E11_04990 [Oecophyllibacter saccharovorans]